MDVSDFFRQIAPVMVVYVLLPFVMLLAYYFGWRRPRNEKRRARLEQQRVKAQATAAPAVPPPPTPTASRTLADPDEMPDIDMLLAEASRAQSAVSAAPVAAPTPKTPASNPQPIPARPAPPAVRVISDEPQPVKFNTGHQGQARELISILRDERDGRLSVQLGDTVYRSLAEDPAAKKQFTRIMKELSGAILEPDENPPDDASDHADPLPPEPDFVEQTPASASPPPPPPSGAPVPGDLPSFKVDNYPAKIKRGRFGGAKLEEFTVPPDLDIPSAIEAYLQYRLQHTDEFAGRELHVHPAPGGGVRIQVDDRYYESVDEVDDIQARAFIKAAIAEWQERQ